MSFNLPTVSNEAIILDLQRQIRGINDVFASNPDANIGAIADLENRINILKNDIIIKNTVRDPAVPVSNATAPSVQNIPTGSKIGLGALALIGVGVLAIFLSRGRRRKK